MSNNAIDETRCNICKNGYTNPMLLKCCHVFCCECLHDSLDSQNDLLSCKTCDESFQMTHKDIDKLPEHMPFRIITNIQKNIEKLMQDPNSILCTNCTHADKRVRNGNAPYKAHSYCIQCQEFFCKSDARVHKRYSSNHTIKHIEEIAYLKIFSQLPPKPAIYCKYHQDLEIKRYCTECDIACCELCAKFLHIHHEVKTVQDSEEILLKKIQDNFETVKEMQIEVASKLPAYIEQMDQILINKENTIVKINNSFMDIHKTIQKRREECEKKASDFYDEQHKRMKDLVDSMTNFRSKIHYAETHFQSSLILFPTYYLFSISDAFNTRLNSIRESVPKKQLRASSIDFTISLLGLKELESKIARIGNISKNTFTNFSNSQILAPSDLGIANDATIHCITEVENKLNILVSEKSTGSNKTTQKIHVIDPSHRKIESVEQSASVEAPTQMAKMASGTVLVTDSINRNVVVLNGNGPKRVLGVEDNLCLSEGVSIAVVKQGDEVAVHEKGTGQVSVLSKELEVLRKIPVKEMVVRRPRNSSSSSFSSAGSSRSNSRACSRMSDSSSPDCAFAGIGRSPTRAGIDSPVSVNSAVSKIKGKPSQTIATNSKNEIIVADEDEPSYTTYSLTGSKVHKQEYIKHISEEKNLITRSNSSNMLKPSDNLSVKRTSSVKRISTQLERSSSGRISPKISKERTLITTDNLDNIYICRNKQILTFNATNTFLRKDKLPENIDPVSFFVNPYGEAYILSSNGELHLFETL